MDIHIRNIKIGKTKEKVYTSWYHAHTNIIECLLEENKGPPGMLTERKMELFCLDCGDYVKFSTLTKTSEHTDLREERFILIHTSRNLSATW